MLYSILEIWSVSFRYFVKVSFSIYISCFAKYACVLTSAHEPFAMYKNWQNSLFVLLAYPSAIFEGIETHARCI